MIQPDRGLSSPWMRGAVADLSGVQLSTIEAAVGSTSFTRGRGYANSNRVLTLEWDPEIDTLLGTVVGHGGLYDTPAQDIISLLG